MDPGGKIYTTDQFRCWKVENLDNESSDENKNEVGRYRVVSPQKSSRFAPLNRYYIIVKLINCVEIISRLGIINY